MKEQRYHRHGSGLARPGRSLFGRTETDSKLVSDRLTLALAARTAPPWPQRASASISSPSWSYCPFWLRRVRTPKRERPTRSLSSSSLLLSCSHSAAAAAAVSFRKTTDYQLSLAFTVAVAAATAGAAIGLPLTSLSPIEGL